MGLEAATYISDLNTANPIGASDPKAQGDDHLRLIKAVLKNTFPGFGGRISRVQAKSGNYTGVLGDSHSTIAFSAAATLALDDAASLGNGWSITVWATAGDVTVDPDASEEVNGATSYVITSGSFALIVCDGVEFLLVEIPYAAQGFRTGDGKITMRAAADPGWILINDGSIGNAASGGTTRANADTAALFSLLWTNVGEARAPMQDSSGVTAAYGANAAADFAANRRLVIPKQLGRALAVAGAGSGLTSRALGANVGTETHALTTAELATHSHGVTDPGHNHSYALLNDGTGEGIQGVGGGGSPARGQSAQNVSTKVTGITVNNAGSGDAHNNMPPESFWNVMVKL